MYQKCSESVTKQAANWNLIFAFGFLGIVILLGAIYGVVINIGHVELMDTQQSAHTSISETRAQEQIGDVEGYGMLAELLASGVYALSGFAARIAFMICIGIPLVAALMLVLFAVIIRIVFAKSHTHFLPYRICATVQHVWAMCFSAGFLAVLANNGGEIFCWIPATLLIYALIAAWIGLRQTIF